MDYWVFELFPTGIVWLRIRPSASEIHLVGLLRWWLDGRACIGLRHSHPLPTAFPSILALISQRRAAAVITLSLRRWDNSQTNRFDKRAHCGSNTNTLAINLISVKGNNSPLRHASRLHSEVYFWWKVSKSVCCGGRMLSAFPTCWRVKRRSACTRKRRQFFNKLELWNLELGDYHEL